MLKTRLSSLIALSTLSIVCSSQPARAFSTRVHILVANKVREALIASPQGRIPLYGGSHGVTLSDADRRALIEQPLAFRAGAIGPDNMAFPGMTDPSHAIEQQPFTQCDLLYKAALTDEERAYAMGCFLHGSTDAIAHHYVNFMSGETFTLTPITSGRASNFSNVVRHILAEGMIQKAAFTLDPQGFSIGQLSHTIPKSFLLRTYLDVNSPLWQLMTRRSRAKFDAAVAKDPSANLFSIISGLGLATGDHLAMAPLYLRHIDKLRQNMVTSINATVAALQDQTTADGAKLKPTAGPDGKLGTSDDRTACSATCPDLYAKYFVYIGLLAPRYDAQNRELPSALNKISEKLRTDLEDFLPAYIATAEQLSAKLNAPLSATNADAFELDAALIDQLFKPLTDWVVRTTTLDYQTAITATVPDWLIQLQNALQAVGVNVSIPNIVRALLEPFLQPIKDALKAYVIDQAKVFLNDLSREYKAQLDVINLEYKMRLASYAPVGISGNTLDRFFESGLYVTAFNIAATALASHAAVLPVGDDPVGIGPASFDASHTMAWMQPAICNYLRGPVFPLGADVRALLSVQPVGMAALVARVSADSPVECHSGSLSMFTAMPGPAACEVIETPELVADPLHRGSPTRAYPPQFAAVQPTCQDIEVPGLPPPPPKPDNNNNSGDGSQSTGCAVAGPRGGSSGGAGAQLALALLLIPGLLLLRRRRRAVLLAGFLGAGLLGASGCSPSEMSGDAMDMGVAGDMTWVPPDLPPGSAERQAMLATLEGTVWQGLQTRAGKMRAFELRFNSKSLLWAEVQNPYGPARRRELRFFNIEDDGKTAHTTVITPTDWTDPDKQNGRKDDFTLEVVPGTPRKLRVTRLGTPGGTEEYTEGAWPKPTAGLTATVRVFTSGGAVDKAFCTSGANGFTYGTLFDFARGKSAQPVIAQDLMAGAKLLKWRDATGQNRFAVSDVPSFSDLGGTALSDQANFLVHYQGVVHHPGGALQLREQNDVVEDGIWVFLDKNVGSGTFFLEVHGFVFPDGTADEPSTNLPAGDIPIEIIVARCAKQISDIDVEMKLAGGSYQLVGNAPTGSTISDTLFPPAL
ncbi:MAG: hypothetical protein U1A78_18215 [Polyangia bacterium]